VTPAARALRRVAPLAVTALALVSGCASAPPRASARAGHGGEPRTAVELRRVAQTFNDEFDSGHYSEVYARWDARSRALIRRSAYLFRHRACPSEPQGTARVLGAEPAPGPGGAWLVHYELGGIVFTDYWYFDGRRWLFDIVRSNPSMARLYAGSFAAYAKAVGCRP